MLMKHILDSGRSLTVSRPCVGNGSCAAPEKGFEEFAIPALSETSKIVLEHRFKYNSRQCIADVAYLDDGEIVCIFEICNTHKTDTENRPEPWFEIDAARFINSVNKGAKGMCLVECIRHYICDDCVLGRCLRCDKERPLYILDKSLTTQMCVMCDKICANRIYLDVPFNDKNKFKDCGGLWDTTYRKWYIKDDNEHPDILVKWSKLDMYKSTPYLLSKAKRKLAKLLREEPEIANTGIVWSCSNAFCHQDGRYKGSVLNNEEDDIVYIDYMIPSKNLVVDVAIVNNDKLKYAFKIANYRSYKTEKIPEPWFEITMESIFERNLATEYCGGKTDVICDGYGTCCVGDGDTWWGLVCARNIAARLCDYCKLCSEKWVENIPTLAVKLGKDNGWFQIKPCVYCKRDNYNPIFIKKYKQLCKICFSNHTAELQKMYKIEGCIISDD
jgi:hypothetical protein